MGKKGDLLRAQKAMNTRYTFTREQLEVHDQQVISARKEAIKMDLTREMEQEFQRRKEEFDRVSKEEWERRAAEFKTGNAKEDFYNLLTYLLSLSSRVLIEQFGWSVPVRNDNRYKILRFGDALVDEINKIQANEMLDIRKYNDETFEKYGIKFERREEG